MTPRDALDQLEALQSRHHLTPSEPLPQLVPDDQPRTEAQIMELAGWIHDLMREKYESHCFWFDAESIYDDVGYAPAVFSRAGRE